MSEARVLGPGDGLTLAPAPEVSFTLKTGTDETNGVWTLPPYCATNADPATRQRAAPPIEYCSTRKMPLTSAEPVGDR